MYPRDASGIEDLLALSSSLRLTGVTADASFRTAPVRSLEPFTFTAFGDEGIPGPSLDRDPSLLPESDWGMNSVETLPVASSAIPKTTLAPATPITISRWRRLKPRIRS